MILGVDPGRSKFGWALATEEGDLCLSGITAVESLGAFLDGVQRERWEDLSPWGLEDLLAPSGALTRICCGCGTGRMVFLPALATLGVPLETVPEKNTTLEARGIYWSLHKPRGFRRLLPLSMLTPPRDVDDLAAFCIVQRFLRGHP